MANSCTPICAAWDHVTRCAPDRMIQSLQARGSVRFCREEIAIRLPEGVQRLRLGPICWRFRSVPLILTIRDSRGLLYGMEIAVRAIPLDVFWVAGIDANLLRRAA